MPFETKEIAGKKKKLKNVNLSFLKLNRRSRMIKGLPELKMPIQLP